MTCVCKFEGTYEVGFYKQTIQVGSWKRFMFAQQNWFCLFDRDGSWSVVQFDKHKKDKQSDQRPY